MTIPKCRTPSDPCHAPSQHRGCRVATTRPARSVGAAGAATGVLLLAVAGATAEPSAPAHAMTADGALGASRAPPAPPSDGLGDLWSKVELGTLLYLRYSWGTQQAEPFNEAQVGRGYLTAKFKPASWFESRVTVDTHQDAGGDWLVRLKYLYGKLKLPVETVVLSEPFAEVGIVHNPWFDFEESINRYRAEGTMFIERGGILNSADLGATAGVLLGDKLPEDYQKEVSDKYPGRYGSVAVGFYNGGGYAALEANDNKTFMARASVRPLGFVVPHWQVCYFLVLGKGNSAEEPAWRLHNFMTSVEHRYFVLTGQIALGAGNQKGDAVDATGAATDLFGMSAFAEAKLPWLRSSLLGRIDYLDWDSDGGASPSYRVIAGHALHFLPPNDLLFTMDQVSYADPGITTDRQLKITLKLEYP